MSSYPNIIYPKDQRTQSYRSSKQTNQDENLIKIKKPNKKTLPNNENFTNREFGKSIFPYIINENINSNISLRKVNENKENIPKKILVEQNNVNKFC